MWLVRGRLICYLPASMAQTCVRPPEPRAGVRRPGDCGGTPCTTQFTHRSPPNVSLLSAAQLALDEHSSHIDSRRMSPYCRRHNLRSMNTVRTSISAECLPTVGGTTCARTPQFTHQSPSNDSLLSAAQLALTHQSAVNPTAACPPAHPISTALLTARPTGKKAPRTLLPNPKTDRPPAQAQVGSRERPAIQRRLTAPCGGAGSRRAVSRTATRPRTGPCCTAGRAHSPHRACRT